MEREREREKGKWRQNEKKKRERERGRDRMKRVWADLCVVYASWRTRPVTVPRVLV